MGILPDGRSESDTERNGLLSYAGEWHALILGLLAGITSGVTGEPALAMTVAGYVFGESKGNGKAFREIKSEPWYAAGGVIIGYIISPVVKTVTG